MRFPTLVVLNVTEINDLASPVAAKKLTPEQRNAVRAVERAVVKRFAAAFNDGDIGQTAALKAANLSNETWRKWVKGKSSPTIRSLVVLAKVLARGVNVTIGGASGVGGTTVLQEEDGDMPDDELLERLQELSEEERKVALAFIDGMRLSKPRPPELPAAQGRRSRGQKK